MQSEENIMFCVVPIGISQTCRTQVVYRKVEEHNFSLPNDPKSYNYSALSLKYLICSFICCEKMGQNFIIVGRQFVSVPTRGLAASFEKCVEGNMHMMILIKSISQAA